MLALLVRLLLAGLFRDVVIRKPYKPREGEQRHDSYLPPLISAGAQPDGKGKDAEADDIAQRVELYAEALFFLAAVFFRSGDYAVEHIAEAREHKTDDGGDELAAKRKTYTAYRRQHADEGEVYGVVVKSDQNNISKKLLLTNYNMFCSLYSSCFDILLANDDFSMQVGKLMI